MLTIYSGGMKGKGEAPWDKSKRRRYENMLPHYYLDDAEANLQTAQRGMRSRSLLFAFSLCLCVCVCVGVYMLVGCHVNKLYMAARLSGCVCVCASVCVCFMWKLLCEKWRHASFKFLCAHKSMLRCFLFWFHLRRFVCRFACGLHTLFICY